MGNLIAVKAVHDADTGVWVVESADAPGLNLEGHTVEELAEKLAGAILDLLGPGGGADVPVGLIAHAITRIRSPAA